MRAKGTRGTFIQQSRAVSPEQKALYHQVLGAGKSRVKREFFDVNELDIEAARVRLSASIGEKLRAAR